MTKSCGNTKTNYWSSKVSSLQEQSQKRLMGDGIPLVRSLLPSNENGNGGILHKQEVSLINFLIEKSKQEAMVRKRLPRSNRKVSPEVLFSKIESEAEHISHRNIYKNNSLTKRNTNLENQVKNQDLCINSRNKSAFGTYFERILQKYKSRKDQLLSKKKNLLSHYKLYKKRNKRNSSRLSTNEYCHEGNNSISLWVKNTSNNSKSRQKRSKERCHSDLASRLNHSKVPVSLQSSFGNKRVQKKQPKFSLKNMNGLISQRRLVFNQSKRENESKRNLCAPLKKVNLSICGIKEDISKVHEENKHSSDINLLGNLRNSMDLLDVIDAPDISGATTQRDSYNSSPERKKIFSKHDTQNFEKSYF
ncbi:unnamed protein product [Moneuplotes crassus]|uniref:Uncharacterized protein n=1 Tax=Euplotes crassus TaxID=5936 RepID=A0AAD1UAW3_EUPCR|nr:unnamed protein product [Moneuplotes crassus]